METIEVDDDVYLEIRKRSRSGETDSQVLRKLLIDAKVPVVSGPSKIGFKASASQPTTALAKFLESPQFLVQSNAIGKFLEILSWLFRQDPEKFKAVLDITGSTRRYFAPNESDLEKNGNSVMPRRIPGAPYFVVSNNDTAKKKRMITDVMRVLGYDQLAISQAREVIK